VQDTIVAMVQERDGQLLVPFAAHARLVAPGAQRICQSAIAGVRHTDAENNWFIH
jgi:hypothetical protein